MALLRSSAVAVCVSVGLLTSGALVDAAVERQQVTVSAEGGASGAGTLMRRDTKSLMQTQLPNDCQVFFRDDCKMTKLPGTSPQAVGAAFKKCCRAGGYSNATCDGIAADTIDDSTGAVVSQSVCKELVDLYKAHVDGPKGSSQQAQFLEYALWARRGEVNDSRPASLDEVAGFKCWLNSHVCESDGCCNTNGVNSCDALTRDCCAEGGRRRRRSTKGSCGFFD